MAVPSGAVLDIWCRGGRGGKDYPGNMSITYGYGRVQRIRIEATADAVLTISPAAHGEDYTVLGDGDNGGAGGGASFVAELNNNNLELLSMAAGGAGANRYEATSARVLYHGQAYTEISRYTGASGSNNLISGAYRAAGRPAAGGGGAGWNVRAYFSDGNTATTASASNGTSFVADRINNGGSTNGGRGGYSTATSEANAEGGFGGGAYGYTNNLSGGGGGYYGGWEHQGSTINSDSLTVSSATSKYSDPFHNQNILSLNAISYIDTGGSSNFTVLQHEDLGGTNDATGTITIQSV